jgi:hypothetical protein
MPMDKKETKGYMKEWFKNHPENIKRSQKKYYRNNREKRLKSSKQWAINNYERVKELARNWRRNKWRTDLKFNLTVKMFRGINLSIKKNRKGRAWGKGRTWEKLVDYTCSDLIKHLKKTIPKGYIWQGYLDGKLQMDHIIPISAFNYTNPGNLSFKKCWSLENMRLLPVSENKIKRTSLIRPFQPTLEL